MLLGALADFLLSAEPPEAAFPNSVFRSKKPIFCGTLQVFLAFCPQLCYNPPVLLPLLNRRQISGGFYV